MGLFRYSARIASSSVTVIKQVPCIVAATIIWGCATFAPQPLSPESLRLDAQTQTEAGVRVSTTVLGAQQTRTAFGLSLYKKGIQPVWIEIENRTRHRMWFLPVSVDRDYFAPSEVAHLHHFGHTRAAKNRMDRHFQASGFQNPIGPGTFRSGFVFTRLELGTKAFNVEVVGSDHRVRAFTFLVPVEGLTVDHRQVDWTALRASQDVVPIDGAQAFRESLTSLPCCTTDADGARPADPINVVIVGRGRDVLYSLLRSGWDETAASESYDPTAQLPWEFRYQPVKPLYLFGRAQDAAFRKSRSTRNERIQLRLWLSPIEFEGKPVWVGQVSRIVRRGVWARFGIEPDVDESRAYLLQDLWYAQAVKKYGYARIAPVVPLSAPRKSLHDDDYFTDGLCLVAWITGEPTSFAQVRFVPWETPIADRREMLQGR